MVSRFFIFSLLVLFFLVANQADAQKPEKKTFLNISGALKKKGPEITTIGDFPNLNKIRYYYNKREFAKIQKFESQKQWEELYTVLKPYVSNFGIENFYKDTFLLWRLAKLTELYGLEADAVRLYKLVLKHHREDIDIEKVELYYDSLSKNKVDYYVPLDYYYELVEYRKEVIWL